MSDAPSPGLFNQREAARYVGIGVRRFRECVRNGQGPRVFNPNGGRPLYAPEVLDEWRTGRDDRSPKRGAA